MVDRVAAWTRDRRLAAVLARAGVVEADLPALDEMDLDVLVHERVGAWPAAALRELLTSSAALGAQKARLPQK